MTLIHIQSMCLYFKGNREDVATNSSCEGVTYKAVSNLRAMIGSAEHGITIATRTVTDALTSHHAFLCHQPTFENAHLHNKLSDLNTTNSRISTQVATDHKRLHPNDSTTHLTKHMLSR